MPIESVLSKSAVEAFQPPIFLKEPLKCGDVSLLAISRDYGSGVEIRAVSIYRWQSPYWRIVLHFDAGIAKPRVVCADGKVQVSSADGQVLLSARLPATN